LDASKTKGGDDSESSEADTFLADMVKKVNCDAKQIPYIFHRARSLSLKLGMGEIQNEFKGCQKIKTLDSDKPSDEDSKDQEGIEPIPPKSLDPEVIFVDRFKNPEKYEQNWIEPFGRMSTVILKNNSNSTLNMVKRCQMHHNKKIMALINKNVNVDNAPAPLDTAKSTKKKVNGGPRSSIAKDAKWIFTHDSYMMKSKRAFCRVKVKDAWLSHSKNHPEASRWSCKAHSNHRQAPFVMSLNSGNTLGVEVKSGKEEDDYQTPGVSFSTIQQKFTNATTGNTTISEQRILMKVLTKKIMDRTMEGGLIKRAMLRLKVLDTWTDAPNATRQYLHVCKIIRKWNVKEVTFSTIPAFDGPITNCKVIVPAAKSQWANIDVTQWLREWVTNPKENFGMMFFPPPNDEDQASFVSFLDPDANERPRLSLSCHGDQTEAYEVVFKEKRGKSSLKKIK